VFISHVDAALEAWLRAALPLTEEVGDVSFDAPNGTWSASLSRITVNLFLYDVQRSSRPATGAAIRPAENGGGTLRRRPQPMFALSYLVSAWAGSPRDEHQLLGDVVSLVAGAETVPAQFASTQLHSSVQLSLGDDRNQPRELWSSAGGSLKASTVLQAIVAADTFDWETQAPAVDRIAAMADRMDGAARELGAARAR
jgi:hypothetical protein